MTSRRLSISWLDCLVWSNPTSLDPCWESSPAKVCKVLSLQNPILGTGMCWLLRNTSLSTQEVFHFPSRPGLQVRTGVSTTLEFYALRDISGKSKVET